MYEQKHLASSRSQKQLQGHFTVTKDHIYNLNGPKLHVRRIMV